MSGKKPDKVVYFRADPSLLEAMEVARARIETSTGLELTQSDLVRWLLRQALAAPVAVP